VAALKDGSSVVAPAPPKPEARFRVLDAGRAEALAAARMGGSHLAAAVVLADAGLADDARKELAALRDANPGSGLAQQLYESLEQPAPLQLPSPTTTKPAQ
jgi:hypothetical protein